MAQFFRCDICGKECKDFWNVTVKRTQIHSLSPSENQNKLFTFDVCGRKCEAAAVAQILSRIVPIATERAKPDEDTSKD